MKSINLRILSILLVLSLLIGSMVLPASASEYASSKETDGSLDLYANHNDLYTNDELEQISEVLSTWSTDELNDYISYLAEASSSNANLRYTVPTGSGQAAWLAAAQILEENGYPCVAALIESSLHGVDYVQNYTVAYGDSGIFQTKIKTTSAYATYRAQLKAGTAVNGKLITFDSSENADLAYSLHSCTAYYTSIGAGNLKTYSWYIYDVYDFAWDAEYNSPLISLVNNVAYLSQQMNVLQVIDVYIHFAPVGTL